MDPMYHDDDGEHRIRVLFNDPIHKEEIVGNKNIIIFPDSHRGNEEEKKVCLSSIVKVALYVLRP